MKIVLEEMKNEVKELGGSQTTGEILLSSVEENETKGGKPYLKLTLSDGQQIVEANLWNSSRKSFKAEIPSVLQVDISAKMFQEKISFVVDRYQQCSEEDASVLDYIIKAPMDATDMFNEIIYLCEKSINTESTEPTLADLVKTLYISNKDKLLMWSAAQKVHHNMYSGLLYHTIRMMRLAYVMAKVYPVDREVMLCSIALHDIGKLKELETDRLGVAEYSVDGTLFNHTLLGIEMINEVSGPLLDQGLSAEKLRCLKHCIASHHGQLEWGAITKPSTIEAFMVHQIDMIDSHYYQYENVQKQIDNGCLSDKIFPLGIRIYKPLDN